MNEAETRAELIDPALKAAGWGVAEGSRVRREHITPGRLQGAGKRGQPEIADYVLIHRNHKLAVIEAKARDKADTEGVGQAKRYAAKLGLRFAFSTNGAGLYRIDMQTGAEGYVPHYPSPDELWRETFAEPNAWRDRFAAVPLEEKGGAWAVRYYQYIAINRVLEAIAAGRTRILLTLATGTGKTAIAFQIAWKLFHSRWNLGREPTRRPRILFLADRNILADQAYNAFSAFEEDALVRIAPDAIRKRGRVPKNGSIFFTIFQTFMSGGDRGQRASDVDGRAQPGHDVGTKAAAGGGSPAANFGDYPRDFFDFIIIDECHRGGANDESSWHDILTYFSAAVQLGLTATPKRRDNVDTYAYFGEPVYTYSLKEGIHDGFLTPFKLRQIATTIDDYVYTADDEVMEGEVEEGRRYKEADFNRIIEIKERERYRVRLFMDMIDQREKALVFCASQNHALAVRDLINQMKTSKDPNYCVRVTAADGKIGEQDLKAFQDNEKTIPTILTTSQKLSTGVDARNVRTIVLMRPVKSMIEFKQIIGRGTRLFDGKDHFTIYDFVKAYEHFNDPEWDGEPLAPDPPTPRRRPEAEDEGDGTSAESEDRDERQRPAKLVIRLADGKERLIQHMSATSYWGPDGKPLSAVQFIERLFGELPGFFRNEDELRRIWGSPDTRKALLQGLTEKGYGPTELAEIKAMINAEKSDVFDVLAYVAFARAPVTREERVVARKPDILSGYDPKLATFLDFVLSQYVAQGEAELSREKLVDLLTLKYHTIHDAAAALGGVEAIRSAFVGFQPHLFAARPG
jgi:type I restriction enzyme R subunit